jgi:hypothetical protein
MGTKGARTARLVMRIAQIHIGFVLHFHFFEEKEPQIAQLKTPLPKYRKRRCGSARFTYYGFQPVSLNL